TFIKPKKINSNLQQEYVGNYLFEKSKVFWNNIILENDTLKFQTVRRNITNAPIPIYSFEKDLFFEIEAELWFHFKRDSLGKIISFERKTHQFIGGRNQKFSKLPQGKPPLPSVRHRGIKTTVGNKKVISSEKL
ncbi:MAG: hypothetical protein QM485_15050, partial [Flavobacteriaceae bacterium]